MRRSLLFPLVLLAVLLSGVTRAEVVDGLYEAVVPVEDHTQAALELASREALAQVLVKMSGSVRVLDNPAISAELARARDYVKLYSYNRDEDAEGDLAARFEFDHAVISDMIARSGSPLWTANRPAVLLWLVSQKESERMFINAESNPQAVSALQASFYRRGVPLRLPLFDLQDSASLGTSEAWYLQSGSVLSASSRYNVSDVLAGRVTELSGGELLGDWVYLSEGQRLDRSVTAPTMEEFIDAGANLVAEAMAARYAVTTTGAVVGGIPMSVAGVEVFADYARIVSWLESLELVENADIELVRGNEILLRLNAQTSPKELATLIALNKRLVPLPAGSAGPGLAYQWIQ